MKRPLILFSICAALAFPGMAQSNYYLDDSHTLIQIMAGWYEPDPDGEIYDFSERELTFDRNRLEGVSFDFAVYRQLNNYVSVGGGFSAFGDAVTSEFREYEFEDGDSIIQETRIEQFWAGAMVMITPFGAGASYGTRAWAPRAVVPYFTFGAGFMTWEFTQEGDFVDVDTLDVFYDAFYDDGVTASLRYGGGLRVNLTKSLDLDFAYLRDLAEDELSGDFEGFGDIGLDARHVGAGLTFRF